MAPHAFVTGGTGFIGINLIHQLVERSWEVTALHRPTSDLSWLRDLPITFRQGSITDPGSLRAAMPEAPDAVFHLAGSTNMWAAKNEWQRKVNVEGTAITLETASEKNAHCFIHTSSVAAWGDMDGLIDEETPQRGKDSWVNYESTKHEGELIARDYAGRYSNPSTSMKVVILNPSSVVGPYDTNNWGRLFTALPAGELPAITDGHVSIAHVREVAKAHIESVERGHNGEHYILGGENCLFSDFIRAIGEVTGVPEKDLPPRMPGFLLRLIGRLSDWKSRFTGNEPDMTPELAKLMTRSNVRFSSKKAQRELGYRIPPMTKSVRDCYEWLKKEGILD